MNKRWDTPETSVSVRVITKNGEEGDGQDCVAGIEILEKGTLRLDLRNLRPLRVLDRDNIVVEIFLADILSALADKVASAIDE